jgi:hypothetical protein
MGTETWMLRYFCTSSHIPSLDINRNEPCSYESDLYTRLAAAKNVSDKL